MAAFPSSHHTLGVLMKFRCETANSCFPNWKLRPDCISVCQHLLMPHVSFLLSLRVSQQDSVCVCCVGVGANQEVGLWSPVPC